MAVRKKKKVVIPRRPKTGIAGAPIDKGFDACKHYFHFDVDRKDYAKLMKDYVKKHYTKSEAKAILACPEYVFYVRSHVAACMHWLNLGLKFEKRTIKQHQFQSDGSTVLVDVDFFYDGHEAIARFVKEAIKQGTPLIEEKEKAAKENANVVVLSPIQRYNAKLADTIFADLDELEDEWICGEEPEFDLYNRFRYHGLTGKAAEPVRKVLKGWLLDLTDAYNKQCEQAVEGYSHLKRSVMRRRIKHIEAMLLDCDKMKAATAATRKPRVKKAPSLDKQVAKVKYNKEDTDFKLVSVPPVTIIGSMRLYVFNTKTREITEYVSDKANGFAIKGTTLQGFNTETSRKIRLRKPDEFLPVAMSKTPKQFDNAWKKLTTKESKPNGRINEDCVLLRVLDK